MSKTFMSPEIQKHLFELIKRNAISKDSLLDSMFINYLYSQKIDEDYLNIKCPLNPKYSQKSLKSKIINFN